MDSDAPPPQPPVEIPPIPVNLPPGVQREVIHELIAELKISEFAGPLPPPDALAEYGRIVTDGANRIMVMAETQATHRQALERAVVLSNIRRSNWGLGLGFIVVMFISWGAYNAIMAGQAVAGTIFGTADIVAIAGLFLYGNQSQRAERMDKAQREQAMRLRNEQGPPPPADN